MYIYTNHTNYKHIYLLVCAIRVPIKAHLSGTVFRSDISKNLLKGWTEPCKFRNAGRRRVHFSLTSFFYGTLLFYQNSYALSFRCIVNCFVLRKLNILVSYLCVCTIHNTLSTYNIYTVCI